MILKLGIKDKSTVLHIMKLTSTFFKKQITAILSNNHDCLNDFYEDPAMHDKVFNDFFNGARWKRVSKSKFKTHLDGFQEFARREILDFANGDLIPGFVNQTEIDNLSDDELLQCVHRCFIPGNEMLADNFRFEFISSPNDDVVLAYEMISD